MNIKQKTNINFKKFIKWCKKKSIRIIILIVIGLTTISTISFGGSFYTFIGLKTSKEYGGGAAITVKYTENGHALEGEELKKAFDSTIQHLDPDGNQGIRKSSTIGAGGVVHYSKGSISNSQEYKLFQESILDRPVLSVYDYNDKPLVENESFCGEKYKDQVSAQTNFVYGEPRTDDNRKVPFREAKVVRSPENQYVVQVQLEHSFQSEWAKLTEYLSKQKAPKKNAEVKNNSKTNIAQTMVLWIGHQKLLKKIMKSKPLLTRLAETRFNLYTTVFVNIKKPNKTWNKWFGVNGIPPARNYMISDAIVSKKLPLDKFSITVGKGGYGAAKNLAAQINYGVARYHVRLLSGHFISPEYGKGSFHKALIAGLIVFLIIAIFMMMNYGLLGIISSVSIALYMFLTLTLFKVMHGEYSPETIASLVIGIGMSVDANIINFERMKQEIYKGSSAIKAQSFSNRISMSTIFDANITTMIVGFVLFLFGTSAIKGFSITLILSIIFTLIVMLLFTRIVSSLLFKLGVFNNREYLLGINKNRKKTNSKSNLIIKKMKNINYIKHSKFFLAGSSFLITSAVIVFSIFAGIAGKLSGGFNSDINFSGGSMFSIVLNSNYHSTGADPESVKKELTEIKSQLISKRIITSDEAKIVYGIKYKNDKEVKQVILKISSKKTIFSQTIYYKTDLKQNKYDIVGGSVTSDVAQGLIKDAMIAILVAFLAIVLYTLIRFKWTFSFAAIIALVHDGLIVTAVFILTRIEFSPIFIAGLLSVLGYSINDTIVVFDRIREKLRILNKQDKDLFLNKKQIRKLANEAIRDTIKRSIITSFTTMIAVIVLLCFGTATKLSFNLSMLVGIVSGTYSSIFIATYIWVLLETKSQNKKLKNKNKNFWALKEKEEQLVVGINNW